MQIRWTPASVSDMQQISDYLGEHHSAYRQPTMRKLYEAAGSLKLFPDRGRLGREPGTRELLLPPTPFIIAYPVQQNAVEILRIFHASQNRN